MTTSNKLKTAAQIILNGILETLARVHGVTVEQVSAGLRAGNAKLLAQFAELADLGANEAVSLHRAGSIHLA